MLLLDHFWRETRAGPTGQMCPLLLIVRYSRNIAHGNPEGLTARVTLMSHMVSKRGPFMHNYALLMHYLCTISAIIGAFCQDSWKPIGLSLHY